MMKKVIYEKDRLRIQMTPVSVRYDNTYDYDANANRIGKHSIEGLTRYSYDANNRLVEVQYPNIMGDNGFSQGNTHYEQLTYDRAGNRIQRVTESLTESYSYDNCNRLTQLQRSYTDLSKSAETVSYSYDKQGNMLSDGKNTYGYDSFSRVALVTTADGNIQKNHYDAEGLRHEMEENGALVKFLFNENKEVEIEEERNGNIIRYIRGLGLICSDSESAKTYYHYVSDEHGSITHVTDAETGEVLNHYTYDAFGNTMECDEKVHNRFRYNGEQYDPLTSQYYLRARFYNPVIARFTQEDTYYGDGLNLYQYCANNPIAYVDPSGHSLCPTQIDLYRKYREEGLTSAQAFNRMRDELGKPRGNNGEVGSAFARNELTDALQREGLTWSEFNKLRLTDVNDLSPTQVMKMKNIRESVPKINENTTIQKTIPAEDIDKYIGESGYNAIGGYVARYDDVSHIKGYDSVVESSRLDYTKADGTRPYPAGGDTYGYIKFKTRESEKINIPYGKVFGGTNTDSAPCTLNGFTGARNGEIVPEWTVNGYMKPIKGSELHKVVGGKDYVIAIFDGDYFREVTK